jgi:hypothetical protein
MGGFLRPLSGVFVVLAAGCGSASVSAHGQVNAVNEGDDRKYEVPEQETPPPAAAPSPAATAAPAPAPPPPEDHGHFLGVAHDLSLSPGTPRVATCHCLMVSVGTPNDPKFSWQDGLPKIDPDTLAVAIASDGVACAVVGHAPLQASIAGVEAHGNDVVITVENVRSGRPVMRGALIARPAPGSSLLVVGKKGTPYGAAGQRGAGACRVPLK